MVEPASVVCGDRRVARVLTVAASDLRNRISRAEAARLACLEPTYFSKCFRKAVGISFARWSTHVRIEAARRLLETSNLRVKVVARAVGYDNITTFERNFRKHTGTCPRVWRAIRTHKTPTETHETPLI